MSDNDFAIIESGQSPNPWYDESTGTMVEPDGSKRAPDLHEEVKHAVMKQRFNKDPVENFKQRLEKSGGNFQKRIKEVEEIDATAKVDPVAAYRNLMIRYGHNPAAVAQHLFNNTSPSGDAAAADQNVANAAIAEFDAKHPDPMTKSLRRAAAAIIEKNDKRLAGCQSNAEMRDRAFALAWADLPQNKARMGPSKILNERDDARQSATDRVKTKMARQF